LRPYLERSAQLSVAGKPHCHRSGKDMEQSMNEVPDDSLANDWAYLAGKMRHDLQVTPQTTLARLNAVRQRHIEDGQCSHVYGRGQGDTAANASWYRGINRRTQQ